jgi:hypothetical protein
MALINTTTTGVLGTTVYGDGSGDLTVQQNGVTVNKITSAPAFSAYNSGNQNLTTSTWTKATLGLEYFDTNNNFDSTTNYRFTPTVAGYYQLNGAGLLQSATNNISFIAISFYKNGGTFTTYGSYGTIPNNNAAGVVISDLIYFNGSSDYVEMYIFATGTSPFCNTVRLSGSMVRSA